MTDEPMRTPRSPTRVPGFAEPPDHQPEPVPSSATSTPSTRGATAPLTPRGGTRQLNVRVLASLLDRYKRLVRDLDDEGFDTSVTELVHALLHTGPRTPTDARRAIRDWRRALDPPE